MSLGVVVPYWRNRPPLENLAVAALADRYGYSELWAGEMDSFDALAFTGAVARETKRITITIGPLAVGVHTPVGMAMGVASVSALGRRPARLAIGVSTRAIVAAWHGRAWNQGPQRLAAAVSIVRQVLEGGRSDFADGPVQSRGFRLTTFPAMEAHVTVAAFGRRATAVAAVMADRSVLNLVTIDQVARQRSLLDELAGPPLAVWVAAAIEPDDGALKQLSDQVAQYLAAPGYGEMFTAAGWADLVTDARSGRPVAELAAAMPVELLQAVAAVGSEAAVRGRIAAYASAGAQHVAVVPVTSGDAAGETVLSALAGDE